MTKKIVIINGSAGCGKDTFIEFVSKYALVTNFSSIDKVKEIAKQIGWDGQKTEKDRKFLSDLKKLTTEYNDMAFKSIDEAVRDFHKSAAELLFIHIREPEEIKKVVKNFEAMTLLIKRDNFLPIQSNYSDANVENYEYDYVITNTTLEELDKQALKFVQTLSK